MKDGDKFARICRSTLSSMPSIYATISQKHFLNLPFHKTFFYIGRFKSWKSFVWNALKRKSVLVVRHFCLEHARGAWRDLLLVTRPFPIALGNFSATFGVWGRKRERARVSPSRAPVFSCAHYFSAPATQASVWCLFLRFQQPWANFAFLSYFWYQAYQARKSQRFHRKLQFF